MWWQGTKFLDKEKARGCRLHPFGAHKGTVLKSVDIEAWVRLLELPVGEMPEERELGYRRYT
jgi:hypothetical protein